LRRPPSRLAALAWWVGSLWGRPGDGSRPNNLTYIITGNALRLPGRCRPVGGTVRRASASTGARPRRSASDAVSAASGLRRQLAERGTGWATGQPSKEGGGKPSPVRLGGDQTVLGRHGRPPRKAGWRIQPDVHSFLHHVRYPTMPAVVNGRDAETSSGKRQRCQIPRRESCTAFRGWNVRSEPAKTVLMSRDVTSGWPGAHGDPRAWRGALAANAGERLRPPQGHVGRRGRRASRGLERGSIFPGLGSVDGVIVSQISITESEIRNAKALHCNKLHILGGACGSGGWRFKSAKPPHPERANPTESYLNAQQCMSSARMEE
jgi:hypothetical protein